MILTSVNKYPAKTLYSFTILSAICKSQVSNLVDLFSETCSLRHVSARIDQASVHTYFRGCVCDVFLAKNKHENYSVVSYHCLFFNSSCLSERVHCLPNVLTHAVLKEWLNWYLEGTGWVERAPRTREGAKAQDDKTAAILWKVSPFKDQYVFCPMLMHGV